MPSFPGSELEAEQFAVQAVSCFPCFLPGNVEHASVVARKDDERIVRDLELIQGLEHFSHDPVEFMDEVPVRAALTCTLELGMGGEGVMNVGGRQVQEERFLLFFLLMSGDPIDRFLGESRTDVLVPVAQVGFLGSSNGSVAPFLGPLLGNGLPAPDEWILGFVIHNAVVFDVNERGTAVHRGHPEVVIEPDFQGAGFERFVPICPSLAEAQVPLPDDRSRIAGGFERVGQSGLFRIDGQFLGEGSGTPKVLANRVLAGQQAVAGGRANGGWGMGIGEAHSLLRQTVDVRGLYFGGAVATEIAVAQVVRVDEDDVGLFGCRRTTQDEAEEGQVFVHSLLDGKLEGFDQWLGGIGRGIGQPQLDLEAKALGQIRESELGGCFGDLLGEALDVIIVFLGLLPLGPLVDFAILVRIDAHPGFHLFNPRTGAHVIVCGLGDEIESSLRESDVGIGMALADFPAKGKGLVYARGREPGDPDSLVCGVKVAKEVVLPADGNGRPVSVSVLLGFVDLIFGDVALETLGILPFQ